MNKICIAVDAMGGDHGPSVTVRASLLVLSEFPELRLILVGREDKIREVLDAEPVSSCTLAQISIENASQVVGMNELPSYALRGKRDSSMRVALNMVQHGKAGACVSAGNTGALMAIARFVLRMLPGVDRPAILFPLPSKNGEVHVLDLGANVDCQAEHLFQFAVMGSVLNQAVMGNLKPKVGLLNVGSEAIKGTDAVKRAAQILSKAPNINYVGFVEGDDIYLGSVDVIVCDGFAGNVALKASEGLAKMMLWFAKEEFNRSWMTKLIALLIKPILKKLFTKFDPNKYNGGSLLGLQGVVVKSHGGANIESYATAIRTAIKEVQMNVPNKIKEHVASQLSKDIEYA